MGTMSPPRLFARVLLCTFWCGLVLATMGCNSGGLVPVTGSVTMEGTALKTGSVTLYPDESKGNTSQEISTGEIVDGKYEIFTNRKRGAPPGAYKVVVVSTNYSGGAGPQKGATAEPPISFIADKYGNKQSTPLSFEVIKNAAAGTYDLKVTKD